MRVRVCVCGGGGVCSRETLSKSVDLLQQSCYFRVFVFLRTESGIVKFTQRLSLKDKHCKEDRSLSSRPPVYRRRSLSVDWYHNIYINNSIR